MEKDSNSYTPSRKALLISAIVYGLTSAVLFIFRPIPPVGLVAAIDLAWVMLCMLYLAFFPRHAERIRKGMERALEKEPRTNLAQGVP